MNYIYKFSIIIAVYNAENYINKTINSVIKQTISFEKNVQLILVDDGSTDNSLFILNNYKKKYPKNIEVISKTNEGQANARNIGLKVAKGKYINFLDSDDYISKNTLENVYNFFEKHHNTIDMVSIPMKLFERINKPHRLNSKFKKTRVINLEKEPNNPQLSAASSFFKSETIKKYEFDQDLVNLEDALLINQILLEKKKYGVINDVTYYYRQRLDHSSTVDSMKLNKKYYTTRLNNFYLKLANYCLKKENCVPEYIQYLFAYDIQWLLDIDTIGFMNNSEKEDFWNVLNQVLNYIELKCILNNKFINKHTLPFFIYLKSNKNRIISNEGNDLVISNGKYIYEKFSQIVLWLDIVEYKGSFLNISGNIETCFDIKNINIIAFRKIGNKIEEYVTKPITYNNQKRKIIQHLSLNWKYVYNFDVKIPLELSSDIYFKIIYNDKKNHQEIIPHISFRTNCGLSTSSAFFIKKRHLILFKHNHLYIKPYSFKSMLRYEVNNMRRILKDKEPHYKYALFIKSLYILLYIFLKNKKIWLFSDRPNMADDNAKYLFTYSCNINDNITKYFVVNKNSSSYNEMKRNNNNIIAFGSLKHKLLYLFSEKIISSYVNENFINPFYYDTPSLYSGLNTSLRYFLQHGVTKDNISKYIKKYDKNLSLIVTVSDLEKKSFLEEGYNYDENVIQTLGFPRFDSLTSRNKKQILFAPTWRLNLTNKKRFLESKYYETLDNFFNNEKLKEILTEYNYSLVFKPHPELAKYVYLSNIPNYVIMSKNESYNELFKNSSLLITDYSSIFFDFSYLKKPIIYYQPNEDYHYDKGYFDYETMGFGDVIKKEDILIEEIKNKLETKCLMEEKYKNRVDKFFKYNDKNNSKRVYEWILKDE